MSELRVGAHVVCSDGLPGGSVDAFIVDPVSLAVTHLVVVVDHLGTRVVLALAAVVEAHAEQVTIRLPSDALFDAERFDEPDYKVPEEGWHSLDLAVDPGSYYLQPFATPVAEWSLTSHERVPVGEVAIRRGSEVRTADDRHIGRVDEFLIDPADGHITHVVLREGHLRHRDVVIPVGAVAGVAAGRVTLGLTTAEVEALPHLPVTRHGHVHAD